METGEGARTDVELDTRQVQQGLEELESGEARGVSGPGVIAATVVGARKPSNVPATGRASRELLAKVVARQLASPPYRGQGYVLTGFPQTPRQAVHPLRYSLV